MSSTTRDRITKAIEQATNVAIIVIALVLSGMFLKSYVFSSSNARPAISAGNKLEVQPVDWSNNTKNLVLVLSTTCRYCKESAGFYRRLTQECKTRHIRTIALFPQPADKARAYLEDEGVQVQEVLQTSMDKLEVKGTPTILLVNNKGLVQHVWTGRLPASSENELLAKLGP